MNIDEEEKQQPQVLTRTEDVSANGSDDERVLGQVITSIMSPEGTRVKIAEMDEAMKYVGKERIFIDEKTNRKLLRKIDWYLCPLMCMCYALQFMDKTSTTYAAVMGLRTDLHMVGQMYSWCGSAFYLGYLVFVYVASRCLQRFPVAKCSAVFVIFWGFILCMHAVPNNYPGFITLRVLLGMFESAITPAFVILTSQWYRTKEQFLRTTIWYAFAGFGNIWGGLIAYGLAKNGHTYSIVSWKVLFIVTGLITVIFGILIYVHIPDVPTQAWFLTEEEKVLVVERIRSNNQGFGSKTFKWYQVREAFTDPTTYIYMIIAFVGSTPSGGITSFGSILLNTTFGYTGIQTTLMNTPTGAVQLVGCILAAYITTFKYFQSRTLMAAFVNVLMILAGCLLAFTKNSKAQLAGLYLLGLAPVGFIMTISMAASNVAGHTKKITVNASNLIMFCAGNIVGPQLFLAKQAPEYAGAKIAIVVCYVIGTICMTSLFFIYRYKNHKRDAAKAALGDSYKHMENSEFADLTDMQNPDFRYAL